MNDVGFVTVKRSAWSALNLKVSDLEDELRAWRALEIDAEAPVARQLDLRAVARNERWRAALGLAPALASLLGVLLDAAGEMLTYDMIFERMRTSQPSVRTVEWPRGLVSVQACKLRRALREAGLGAPIETVWGVGYRMAAQAAARLNAWIEIQSNQRGRTHEG